MGCDFWRDLVNVDTGCENPAIDPLIYQYGYVGNPWYWGHNSVYNDTFFFNQIDTPVFDMIISEGLSVELNGFSAVQTSFGGRTSWESVAGSRILRVVLYPDDNAIQLHYKLESVPLGGASVHYINVVIKATGGEVLFDATASLDWAAQMLSVSNSIGRLLTVLPSGFDFAQNI
jgi:hypothetical protein